MCHLHRVACSEKTQKYKRSCTPEWSRRKVYHHHDTARQDKRIPGEDDPFARIENAVERAIEKRAYHQCDGHV